MAEQESGAGGKKRGRSMKPKPGVIDLDAQDVTPDPEPAATPGDTPPDPDPAVHSADASDADPRSPVGALIAAAAAGAAIGILAFILLLATEVFPLPGADPALGSRLAALEQRVAEPAPAVPPADDSALRGEIDSLRKEIEALRAAPAPQPARDEGRDEERDAALDARLAALESRLADISEARTDNASSDALAQLAARVDDLARKQAEAPPPDPGIAAAEASARRASALAAVSSLESAVTRGAPYAAALLSLRAQLPDAAVEPLAAAAERGLDPADLLARRLSAALSDAPAPPSTASGLVERLTEGAKNLVRVRPVDGSVPVASVDDPWSVRNAVAIRLEQGDYAGALKDWDKLDAAAKTATEDAARALRERLAADAALDELRASALGRPAERAP